MRGDVYLWGVGSPSLRCAALFVCSLVCVAWFNAGCGGSEASAGKPTQSAHDHAASAAGEQDDAPSADDTPAEEEAPPASPCDDGTCTPCGKGVCPTGWYCDESAAG